jgi:GNAT superfamily N-acetyltransferase
MSYTPIPTYDCGMIIIREATEDDIPAIFSVRTSVRENHLSVEQMAEFGITHEVIRSAIRKEPCIWVAVAGDRIVGFAMGQADDACLFALFVRPKWERHGIGTRLLARAEAFLFRRHHSIWLRTDGSSRAAAFYEKLGWNRMEVQDGETRFEKHRP